MTKKDWAATVGGTVLAWVLTSWLVRNITIPPMSWRLCTKISALSAGSVFVVMILLSISAALNMKRRQVRNVVQILTNGEQE